MSLWDAVKPKPEKPHVVWGEDFLELAQTLYERADYKRAFAKAVRAIEAWPTNSEAYVVAGDSLRMLTKDDIRYVTELNQDEDTPENYYRAALLHEPDDEHRGHILHKLGQQLARQGYYTEAAAQYEEAVIYMPAWGTAWYFLAYYRSKVNGELDAVSLVEAFGDPEAVSAAQDDVRWEPWREQVDGLIEEANKLIEARANDAYHKATKAIDRAEASFYASRRRGSDAYTP